MQVLVFNAGSSSLKFGIFSVTTETHEVFKGSYELLVFGFGMAAIVIIYFLLFGYLC